MHSRERRAGEEQEDAFPFLSKDRCWRLWPALHMCFPDSTCLQIRVILVRSLELSNCIRLLMVCFCCEEWSWEQGSRRASVNVPFGWEDICQPCSPHTTLCFLIMLLLSKGSKKLRLYFGLTELLKQLFITNTHVWWRVHSCLLFLSFHTPHPVTVDFCILTFYSTNTKQFSRSFLLIFMLSFSKVCFSFEMVKDNSVLLYFTRHRWCLLEIVCHTAFSKHQKSKAKKTLVSKWGVNTVVWLLELRGESKGTLSSTHISYGVCL